MTKPDIYGTQRVLEPQGVMPQAAWKIDNRMQPYDNELLIDVDTLNIDSASFTQIEEEAGHDIERIKAIILRTVAERGKQHNPKTGSGGMLIGTVAALGKDYRAPALTPPLAVGDRIATLVSLSLTPLRIDQILGVKPEVDQVRVKGQAILFQSGIFARLPADMEPTLALAALDVAGAPAQTMRLCNPGDTVLVIGAGGKSGLLCLYCAKKRVGPSGKVIALAHSEGARARIAEIGAADLVLTANATRPLEVLAQVSEATGGRLADVVINTVNVPDTEMSSILSAREDGTIYFFSMATSFTKAALGAEGVGKDVRMLVGNGYARGHAELTLDLLRESEALRRLFTRLYA